MDRILITGGAGFIGKHLAREFISKGNYVRVLDCLDPAIHTTGEPLALPEEVEFVRGDVRDRDVVMQVLNGVDIVYHLAAKTSVDKSMKNPVSYIDHNIQGTANVLNLCRNRVRRFVLASSRAVYAEGAAFCNQCGIVTYASRRSEDLDCALWEPQCALCGSFSSVKPVACEENTLTKPSSIYGLTKMQQEDLTTLMLQNSNTDWMILRYFNVYGDGYMHRTDDVGIVSIFTQQLMNGQRIRFYEDGLQTRDFVHIKDVTRANMLAQAAPSAIYNIGCGQHITLCSLVEKLEKLLGVRPNSAATGTYRLGDVRHCISATTFSRNILEWKPKITLEAGLKKLIDSINQTQN